MEIISGQISSLKAGIKRLEEAITLEAKKLEGYANLRSIKGIGARSAGVLLAVIGEVADFSDENKLAAYFGIVPRVANSNEVVKTGRITKRGNKTARTCLVQCTLTVLRCNACLKKYCERVKQFADFNNFVLAG